jgi:acetylornithine deacetylase/succinyl-diaminopimelate desuccinylase-like protein
MGVPTIGFGPAEYKLAHMTDEKCEVSKIKEACLIYCQLIKELY